MDGNVETFSWWFIIKIQLILREWEFGEIFKAFYISRFLYEVAKHRKTFEIQKIIKIIENRKVSRIFTAVSASGLRYFCPELVSILL